MTSACIFKDTLRNDTQVFLNFGNSIFEICLHLINSNSTPYFLSSSMLSTGAGTSRLMKVDYHYPQYRSLFDFNCSNSAASTKKTYLAFKNLQLSKMASNLSLNSIDSDVFYLEHSCNDQSLPRPNTPIVLNSTGMSSDDP